MNAISYSLASLNYGELALLRLMTVRMVVPRRQQPPEGIQPLKESSDFQANIAEKGTFHWLPRVRELGDARTA